MAEAKGKKHSRKREAILELLRGTKSHPGAQWVYERLKPSIPGLSLGTVYRNLSLFRNEGLALSLGSVNGEERFDGSPEPHPHLVCRRCGAIEDLELRDGETFKNALAAAFACGAFSSIYSARDIDFRRTMFYGLCRDCEENENTGLEPL